MNLTLSPSSTKVKKTAIPLLLLCGSKALIQATINHSWCELLVVYRRWKCHYYRQLNNPLANKVCSSYLLIPTGTQNIKHFIHTHIHHINEGRLLIDVFHTFQSQESSNGLWTPKVTRCAAFSIEKFNFIHKNIKLKETKYRLDEFCKYYPKICSDFLGHIK